MFRAVVVRVRRETIRDSRDHSGSPLPVYLVSLVPRLGCPNVGTEKTRFKLGLQDSITRKRRALVGFPCGSTGKEPTCNAGDPGSISGLGRSPGEGKGYPLQYSGLEKSMDYTVRGFAKSWTRLSNFHFPMSREFQCITDLVSA